MLNERHDCVRRRHQRVLFPSPSAATHPSFTRGGYCTVARVFIHSRLDYCNALFADFPVGQLTRLQSVLSAAALVLGLPGRALVSAAMHNSLHWLSYPQRVTYKLCLLYTYNCLQGREPVNLSRLCVPTASVSGRSRLRSADDNQLLVPRTLTVTFGPTSGPDAWNTLSSELRHSSVSLDCFKRSLKTFLFLLFSSWTNSWFWFACRNGRLCDDFR